ncbi:MAG: M20 family peptidase [Acidobacteria bacterium]|nr:M20 family peptidase [Acidobacteriota bacterium]
MMLELVKRYEQRLESILRLTGQLVCFESKSKQEVPLNRLASFVGGILEEAAGGVGRVESIPAAGYGTHLRAVFPFGHDEQSPGVLVIGHLDTVWPLGTLERKPFIAGTAENPDRATGPGIFDMKAGIALLIESLRTISGADGTGGTPTRRPVRLLLTCDEEIGSPTSRQLVEEEAKRSVAALVLEPPLTGGILKTGRKGIAAFTVRAIGRAAHAGLDPREGINAVVELAHQIIDLAGLNDFERGVTVNTGLVTGGTGLNVVPAEAVARVDLRFQEPADGELAVSRILSLKPYLPGAKLEVSGGINRPAMPRSERNLALFAQARQLAQEIGMDLQERAVGGGSDGNFTAALGVPTLDGLGVDGGGAHAEDEHILISDIPRRSAILTRLLQTV